MDRPSVSALEFASKMLLSLMSSHRAQGLCELHERGGTREDIEGALRIMPFASSRSPHLLA